MAIRTVTSAGIKKDSAQGSYKKSDPFTSNFRMFNLNKPGQNFKIRVLPPNNDEKIFKDAWDGFAFALPTHFGVGDNGKEMCLCPNRLAPRYRVKCPMCAEFSSGNQTKRSKLTFYYYINFIILSKHEGVERTDKDGKFIVYTARVPKAQVFDPIAKYLEDQERAIVDPFSLTDGCAITISVTEKKVGSDKFPQYSVQFNEASTGTLVGKVREEDIKDLRLIGRFIPTNAAMRNIAEGMPILDAMDVCGKIDTTTGQQIGGTVEAAAAADKAKDDSVSEDLSNDLEIGEDELPPSFSGSEKSATSSDDLDADDLIIDGDSDDDLPL